MPSEPEESTFKDRVRATAYPCQERNGVVWAYLGPPGLEPPLPDFAWTKLPPEQVCIIKVEQQSNWAQGIEGVIDSAHASYLHAGDIRPLEEASVPGGTSHYVKESDAFLQRPSNDRRPRLEAQNTDYGFRYAAIRKPIREPERYKYIRTTAFVAPCFAFFAPPPGWIYMQCWVPIDDEHSMFYFVQADVTGPVDEAALRKRSGLVKGVDLDEHDRSIRTSKNLWLQDREAMRRGSFSGIHGVQNQDMAVQESMGPIYDRTKEHLGSSDVAVIRFRRLMLDAARRVQAGGVPLGLERPVPYDRVAAEEKIIPIETPWQVVGAFAGEPVIDVVA
jgi:phthalate 4,5-dioxygenase oxygenase subunit